MRFLADENFPSSAVVLAQVSQGRRILLTFDKDFGELAKASSLPTECGIVLLRIPLSIPGQIGKKIADLVLARE